MQGTVRVNLSLLLQLSLFVTLKLHILLWLSLISLFLSFFFFLKPAVMETVFLVILYVYVSWMACFCVASFFFCIVGDRYATVVCCRENNIFLTYIFWCGTWTVLFLLEAANAACNFHVLFCYPFFFFFSYFVQLLQPWLITVAWTLYHQQNLSCLDNANAFFFLLHVHLVLKNRALAKCKHLRAFLLMHFILCPYFAISCMHWTRTITFFGARTANLTGNQNQLSRLLFFIIAYAVTLHCIEPQVCVRIGLGMPLKFMK